MSSEEIRTRVGIGVIIGHAAGEYRAEQQVSQTYRAPHFVLNPEPY